MFRREDFKWRNYVIVMFMAILGILLLAYINLVRTGRVLPIVSRTDDVQVTARVQNCNLELKVYPEKRIPLTGNWDTLMDVNVTEPSSTTQVAEIDNITTSTAGEYTHDLCDNDEILLDQAYDFYVEGYSHLRKRFANENYSNAAPLVDLTTGGRLLLAGDTSVIKDNKINSLDISTQVNNIYSNDFRNDLNQDGLVNSLDISNTIYNFYLLGD